MLVEIHVYSNLPCFTTTQLYNFKSFPTSQLQNFTATKLHCFKTSQVQNFTASKLHSLKTSQPQNFTASKLHNLKTSQPQNFTTSRLLIPSQVLLEHHLLIHMRPGKAEPPLVEQPGHGGEHPLCLGGGGRNTEVFPEIMALRKQRFKCH